MRHTMDGGLLGVRFSVLSAVLFVPAAISIRTGWLNFRALSAAFITQRRTDLAAGRQQC